MIDLDIQYPPIEVTVAPSELPVSIDDARRYCDYEDNDRNDQFDAWIRAATQQVERDCEVALITQTCKLYLPCFPCSIEIAKPPVSAVSSISYVDTAGSTQTLSTSVYQSNLKRTPARITEAYGQVFPSTQWGTENAVTVTFVAGYGAASAVPPMFKEAIKVRVKRLFMGCMDGEDMVYEGLISGLRWRPYL